MTPPARDEAPYGLDDLVADQRRQTRFVWLVLLAAVVFVAGRRLAPRDASPTGEQDPGAPVASATSAG